MFDVPRLSVDIDLNYVGNESRDAMLEERPKIVDALQAVFSREDFVISWASLDEHAADKWSLRYLAASGQRGRVDVDVNYMYRVPLWPIDCLDGLSSPRKLEGYGPFRWWTSTNSLRGSWSPCWTATRLGTCSTAA